MKTILSFLLLLPTIFYSQISRKVLDYTINDSKIIRRINDKNVIFETDKGDIVLTLYSDSINNKRQTLNLLICYPPEYGRVNIKLIIKYVDDTEEIVPNFPDVDNCSIYYFLNRLNFIYYKEVKSITFLGLDKFDMEDKNFFLNFIKEIKLK